VEPLVVAVVLVAAVLHATWNALVKLNGDRLVLMAALNVCSAIIALACIPFLPLPEPSAWWFLGLSVIFHIGYQTFLLEAYRHGDLGHVYPIARGTAPLMVAAGAFLLLGERLEGGSLLAVVVIAAGIISLAFRGGPRLAEEPRPVLYALATACFIAAYTMSDGHGARVAGSPHAYTAWLFLLEGIAFPAVVLARRPGALSAMARAWRPGLAGGVMSMIAYWLVIWALTRGSMAPVAALRETSVIFAAVIGAVFLGERFGGWRIAAAALVAAGVILLRLG
jgi:drug/metabolite transporter (DMT)-like permease